MSSLAGTQNRATYVIDVNTADGQRNLRALAMALRQADGQAAQSTRGITAGTAAIASAAGFAAVMVARFAANMAASFVKSSVAIAIEQRALQQGMSVMLGSAEAGERAINRLRQAALKPGVTYEAATGGFMKLISSGMGAEDAVKTIEAFGGAMAFAGGTAHELQLILRGLAQMMGKGKITAEDLNQQILEQAPMARQALQREFGTAVPEILQGMGLSVEEFIQRWVKAMSDMQPPGTLKNSLINLKDAWMQTREAFGRGLIGDQDIASVDKFADSLRNLKPEFGAAGTALRERLTAELQHLADAFLLAKESGGGFLNFLGQFMRGVTPGGASAVAREADQIRSIEQSVDEWLAKTQEFRESEAANEPGRKLGNMVEAALQGALASASNAGREKAKREREQAAKKALDEAREAATLADARAQAAGGGDRSRLVDEAAKSYERLARAARAAGEELAAVQALGKAKGLRIELAQAKLDLSEAALEAARRGQTGMVAPVNPDDVLTGKIPAVQVSPAIAAAEAQVKLDLAALQALTGDQSKLAAFEETLRRREEERQRKQAEATVQWYAGQEQLASAQLRQVGAGMTVRDESGNVMDEAGLRNVRDSARYQRIEAQRALDEMMGLPANQAAQISRAELEADMAEESRRLTEEKNREKDQQLQDSAEVLRISAAMQKDERTRQRLLESAIAIDRKRAQALRESGRAMEAYRLELRLFNEEQENKDHLTLGQEILAAGTPAGIDQLLKQKGGTGTVYDNPLGVAGDVLAGAMGAAESKRFGAKLGQAIGDQLVGLIMEIVRNVGLMP